MKLLRSVVVVVVVVLKQPAQLQQLVAAAAEAAVDAAVVVGFVVATAVSLVWIAGDLSQDWLTGGSESVKVKNEF